MWSNRRSRARNTGDPARERSRSCCVRGIEAAGGIADQAESGSVAESPVSYLPPDDRHDLLWIFDVRKANKVTGLVAEHSAPTIRYASSREPGFSAASNETSVPPRGTSRILRRPGLAGRHCRDSGLEFVVGGDKRDEYARRREVLVGDAALEVRDAEVANASDSEVDVREVCEFGEDLQHQFREVRRRKRLIDNDIDGLRRQPRDRSAGFVGIQEAVVPRNVRTGCSPIDKMKDFALGSSWASECARHNCCDVGADEITETPCTPANSCRSGISNSRPQNWPSCGRADRRSCEHAHLFVDVLTKFVRISTKGQLATSS